MKCRVAENVSLCSAKVIDFLRKDCVKVFKNTKLFGTICVHDIYAQNFLLKV